MFGNINVKTTATHNHTDKSSEKIVQKQTALIPGVGNQESSSHWGGGRGQMEEQGSSAVSGTYISVASLGMIARLFALLIYVVSV